MSWELNFSHQSQTRMKDLSRFLVLVILSTLIALFFVFRIEMSFSKKTHLPRFEDENGGFRLIRPTVRSEHMDNIDNLTISIIDKQTEMSIMVMRNHSKSSIAVLVITCNRKTIDYCLRRLLSLRPSAEKFPIIVSQDCENNTTADIVKGFGDKIFYIRHSKENVKNKPRTEITQNTTGYMKIARHYAKALNKTFFDLDYKYAIIVEDDLDVSVDFFEYFLATLPILKADPTLFCVSAWNDNGKPSLIDIDAPQLLYRTDFFPGLGWMLTRATWSELAWKWPSVYWDDWIRQPEQRKGRACVRPEISRTKHPEISGVSQGDDQLRELKWTKLNDKFVPFTHLDLTYLLKTNYDRNFIETVYRSQVISWNDLVSAMHFNDSTRRSLYCNEKTFPMIAKQFGFMKDFKSGVPRTAYKHVVSFFYKNARIYLVVIPDAKHSSKVNSNLRKT